MLKTKLLRLKKRTGWSWERMCREMHRIQGEEGPSHTTLFRYASDRIRRPNKLTEKYISDGADRLLVELKGAKP